MEALYEQRKSTFAPLNLTKPKKEDNNNQINLFDHVPPQIQHQQPESLYSGNSSPLSHSVSSSPSAAATAIAALEFFRKTKGLFANAEHSPNHQLNQHPTSSAASTASAAASSSSSFPLPPQLPDVVSTLPMFPHQFKSAFPPMSRLPFMPVDYPFRTASGAATFPPPGPPPPPRTRFLEGPSAAFPSPIGQIPRDHGHPGQLGHQLQRQGDKNGKLHSYAPIINKNLKQSSSQV